MSRRTRRGAEFSKRIIEEERLKWHAKNPGQQDAQLNVHHILPIAEGVKRGVSKILLSSQQNAIALEEEFHNEVHRKINKETLDALAQALINTWAKLF